MPVDTVAAMPETDWISRAIALVEVIGGAVGIGLASQGLHSNAWFLALLVMLVYTWSVIAGVKLWRQRDGGWVHSIVVQVLQIPWIITPHLSYQFAVGCGAWLGFGSDGWVKSRALASRFDFSWATGFGPQFDNAPWHLAFNIVAIAAAAYLFWRYRQMKSLG